MSPADYSGTGSKQPVEGEFFRLPWFDIGGAYEEQSLNFEHCCADLAHAIFGFDRPSSPYGRRGQKQHGVDVINDRAGRTVGVQAKLHKMPKTAEERIADLNGWLKEVRKGLKSTKLDRLVICVPWSPDTQTQDWQESASTVELHIEVWNSTNLDKAISPYPLLIHRYFGAAYARDVERFASRNLAAAIKGGIAHHLGIEELLHEYSEAEEAEAGETAARLAAELAERFERAGLAAQAESHTLRSARALRKVDRSGSADLVEASLVVGHIETASMGLAEYSLRHALGHASYQPGPNVELANHCMAAVADLAVDPDLSLLDELIDSARSEGSRRALLLLGECAAISGQAEILGVLARTLADGEPLSGAAEARRLALLIDADLSTWDPKVAEANVSADDRILAWARQARRLYLSLGPIPSKSEVDETVSAFEIAAEHMLVAGDVRSAAACWVMVQRCLSDFGFYKSNEHMVEVDETRRSLYRFRSEESELERLQRMAADGALQADSRDLNRALQQTRSSVRSAFALGNVSVELDLLSRASRIALELEEFDESLRLALLAGSASDASAAVESGASISEPTKLLSEGWSNRRLAAVAAVEAHPSTWSAKQSKDMSSPLKELCVVHVRGQRPQPVQSALPALVKLAPSVRSVANLVDFLESKVARAHVDRFAESAVRDLLGWVAIRATDRQLETVLDRLLACDEFDERTTRAAAATRAARSGASQIDRLSSSLSPEETLRQLLDERPNSEPRIRLSRNSVAPDGRHVESWNVYQEHRAIKHLVTLADAPYESAAGRVTLLRDATHIARWATLSKGRRRILADMALDVADTHESQVDKSAPIQMPGADGEAIRPAAMRFLAALQRHGEEVHPTLSEYTLRELLCNDSERQDAVVLLLSDLLHRDVDFIDAALLGQHPNPSLRSLGVIQALSSSSPNFELLRAAIRDPSPVVRRTLARHRQIVESLGARGSAIALSIAGDPDASIRSIADSVVSQCPHH